MRELSRAAVPAIAALLSALAAHAGVARADDAPLAPRVTPATAPAETDLLKRFEEREDAQDGWGWIGARFLLGFFYQQGHGLQSQSGEDFNTQAPVDSPGSEEAFIVEPMAMLTVRQSKHFTHEFFLPVDVVTAASPDALDVVATASATNEAFAVDVTSTYSPNEKSDFAFRYGFHVEEPFRSFDAGPAFTFHLAEDNTVLRVSALVVADGFDPVSPKGVDHSYVARTTLSGNFAITQLLSPTTVLDASFGATDQWGILSQTYNSVLIYSTEEQGSRVRRAQELFPPARSRFAWSARLSQFIPESRSTVKASYRFYLDENLSLAHTGELELYQWLGPWFYVRLHGRLHTQIAPDFWAAEFHDPRPAENDRRTSDSDLQTLNAREAGVRLVLQRDRAPRSFRATDSFSLGYLHYARSNSLTEDYVNFGYEKRF
ncbi:MAG: DUF3570 domain-containing protein [Polyangiaceae bacterium]